MNRFDLHTEYIVSQADYQTALASLPTVDADEANDGQLVNSVPVMVYEYRLNNSQTINAGKWTMWAVTPMLIVFEWRQGAWHPPANLVVRRN